MSTRLGRESIHPGNREFVSGDRIPRPGGGQGRGGKASNTGQGEDDFVFILVPGDRVISWPKLRNLIGVSRLSLPAAATAKEVTGYERGTITPFGAANAWPVIADERLRGRVVTLGAGEHGVAVAVDADEAVEALEGSYADISE